MRLSEAEFKAMNGGTRRMPDVPTVAELMQRIVGEARAAAGRVAALAA